MMLLKKISLLLLIFLIISCVPKARIATIDKDTLSRIFANNTQICSYKGKIVIRYQDERNDISLKGYLDKACNKDFHLVVLGPLNIVMADITYKDGAVTADKNGEDISLFASYIMKAKNVDATVELIRYPFVEVDDTYTLSAEGGNFILKKDDITVKTDADCYITEITDGRRKFTYEYENNKIYNIYYEYKDQRIKIGLR
ncbi:MAG: hypothetical protein AB7E96_00685 [Deferribacterales bacterium]